MIRRAASELAALPPRGFASTRGIAISGRHDAHEGPAQRRRPEQETMLTTIIGAFVALFTTTEPAAPACESYDQTDDQTDESNLLAEEAEPIAEAVCGSPLCVYQTPAGTFTNRCDTSCVWEAGVAQTCGGYTCTPIAPASSCRWHCV